MSEELAFETVDRGEDVRIFRLTGKCTLYNTNPLKDAVDAALKDGRIRIVFDLAECEFMDSAGMGVLVSCKFKASKQNGAFAICNVPAEILSTIRLARLDRVITVESNVEKAISGLQPPESSPSA